MAIMKFSSQIQMNVPPTADSHVVTLGVLNDTVNGKLKSPVRAATTGHLDATYASKVLTAGANGALLIDGVTLLAGDRVLVKDQTDKTQNGIYAVTDPGDTSNPFVLTRASDFDNSSELISGVNIYVAEGTSNAGDWKLASPAPLTLDTSNLVFKRAMPTNQAVMSAYDIIGDGSTAQFDFSHSFGTKDVIYSLYEVSTGEEIITDVKRLSVNDIRVEFGAIPAVGENYRLVVMAVVAH
jgi:hypothetical protein